MSSTEGPEAIEIAREFEIAETEARTYVLSLSRGTVDPNVISSLLNVPAAEAASILEHLFAQGVVIHSAAKGQSYAPLHPRLALSNLYRLWTIRHGHASVSKRMVVDRLAPRLAHVYQSTRGTSKQ